MLPFFAQNVDHVSQPSDKRDVVGNINAAGDFVTGNKIIQGDDIQGDKVVGDKIAGDKIVNIYVTAAQEIAEANSPLLAVEIERRPFEPETILIAAGRFEMGSDDGALHERPRHDLLLPVFRIGKYPVTNAQYAEFLKRNPQAQQPDLKHWFQRRPKKGLDNFPVVNVDWQDALNYCRWLSQATGRSYALPSEAQWEKAARGGDNRRYPWGDEWQVERANLNRAQLTPVDAHPTGASLAGCLDLLGNMEEWTSTLWGVDERVNQYPYPYRAEDGREDATVCAFRIHRGGSYRSAPEAVCCTTRSAIHQESKVPWRGLRVVINDYTHERH